jgi:hypothetical protein
LSTLRRVARNDFPDELIRSETGGDFHDWPETWQRSSA